MTSQLAKFTPALLNIVPLIWGSILLYMEKKAQVASPTVNYSRVKQLGVAGLALGILGLGTFFANYFYFQEKSYRTSSYVNYATYGLGAVGVVLTIAGQALLMRTK